jgi:hypothetical protein
MMKHLMTTDVQTISSESDMNSSTGTTHAATAKNPGALQHLWQRVRDWFGGVEIVDRAGLTAFLDANAALVAQKCAIDYCRGKTGAASHALFKEEVFINALTRCRWEAYAAVLADLMLIVEERLLDAAKALGRQAELKPALAHLYAEVLKSHPSPAHRTEGWTDLIESFKQRQSQFNPASGARPDEIALHSARTMFDTLPIHTNMRKFDEEIVFGAVRFHVVGVSQRLTAQLRPAAVARSLLTAD